MRSKLLSKIESRPKYWVIILAITPPVSDRPAEPQVGFRFVFVSFTVHVYTLYIISTLKFPMLVMQQKIKLVTSESTGDYQTAAHDLPELSNPITEEL